MDFWVYLRVFGWILGGFGWIRMDIGGFSPLVMSGCGANSNFPEFLTFSMFFCDFYAKQKLRLRGRDPSRKIRSGILRRTPVRMPQKLLWRPI